jgi:hypothetical protein
MTKGANKPLWLPPISFVIIPLIIGIVSFSSKRFVPFAVTGQAFFLIIVLRTFYSWPPMARWVGRMPVPHRAVSALILLGMVAGHFSLQKRAYFPFIPWYIFPSQREDDPVTSREFIATTASGKQVRLLPEQLFPSIIQVDPLAALDDPKLYPPGTTDHLAHALAKVYNEHHANDPVQQIDLILQAVQLHPPPNESRTEPSCELLKRYDISSDRWN